MIQSQLLQLTALQTLKMFGTILIGEEQITYTAKTATTFTTCTRGANSTSAAAHSDDVTVSRANVWYDVTRASGGDYSATAAENWTSTIIGGVLVMTNGFDDPQYWALTNWYSALHNQDAGS